MKLLHDNEIRDDLCMHLEEKYKKVRFFDELMIGKSRADIVMVVGEGIFGVEIKSDADTYARLERQVKYYDKFFDYNILAVGSSHGLHAEEHVPKHWGIVTIEEIGSSLDFYWLREPSERPPQKKVKLKNQLHLLWRREMLHIQQLNKLYKYAGKNRRFIEEYLLSSVPEDVLKKQLLDELFERDYTIFIED